MAIDQGMAAETAEGAMLASPRRRRRRRQHSSPAWEAACGRVLWLEPIWIALLAPSLLFPGRFWVAASQPTLVLLLFLFWPLRLLAPQARAGLPRPWLFVLPL